MADGKPPVRGALTFTSAQLLDRLRNRYPASSHVILEEVRNGAGFSATRSADALVMGLWPSRGLLLEGFEVKRDRRDWLRELTDPGKADPMFAYCDRWWLLASPGVALEHEVPPPWGLLVATTRGLTVARAAPQLDPKPLTRTVLAAILKRAWGVRPGAEHLAEERRKALEEGTARGQNEARSAIEELKRLQRHVQLFEDASGLRIEHGWEHAKLGAAVKRYLDEGMPGEQQLHQYREGLVRILAQLDQLTKGDPDA